MIKLDEFLDAEFDQQVKWFEQIILPQAYLDESVWQALLVDAVHFNRIGTIQFTYPRLCSFFLKYRRLNKDQTDKLYKWKRIA